MQRPERAPSPLRVRLVGDDWESVRPAMMALAGGGAFVFERPGASSTTEEAWAVALASPRSRDVEAGLGGKPLVQCVPAEELESAELFLAADDIVVVPCTPAELAKRLYRLVRRWVRDPKGKREGALRVGPVELDTHTFHVTVGGRTVPLAWMEFQLLRFLMENPGRIFRRQELLAQVWGTEYFGGPRTVDVHIRRLRAKLGQVGERSLRTVRNVGYGLEAA